MKTGGAGILFPEGTSIETAPYEFMVALDQAVTVHGWMENLQKDELPPVWMWTLDTEIKIWFEKVKRERDEKYGGSKDKKDSAFDNEGPGIERNDHAARFYE